MQEFENNMHLQVLSLPALMREQYADLEPKVRVLFSTPEIFSLQRIILTGCGDSHAAAMAMKYAIEALTGLPVDVVSALELSRFYNKNQLGFAPNNPLVIAVSNSGGILRISEAIQRANHYGAFTLGITGNRESALGKSAQRVLDLKISPFASAPGTRSYLVSLMALYLLAIRIGEVRGRFTMDRAMEYRMDILPHAEQIEKDMPKTDAMMLALAKQWQTLCAYDFIGAGQDFAAAWYGHAKIFEAVGRYAMCINTEEWLHLNFFMREVDKIGTVLVCSSDSPALSRALELEKYAVRDMGRPMLVITDCDGVFTHAENVCRLPKSKEIFTGAMSQFIPLSLLAGYLGEMIGEVDGRGCVGPWAFAQGGAGITTGKLELI